MMSMQFFYKTPLKKHFSRMKIEKGKFFYRTGINRGRIDLLLKINKEQCSI